MNERERVAWVDYAKGICIVMVVAMHATYGVEAAAGAEGWMHHLVAFTSPFRMPDFFLIAGLFLARTIDRPWREYADRKVVHFAYFYVLWLAIQFAVKTPTFAAEIGWDGTLRLLALSLIDPLGTMWFIYALPIFLVVTKLARRIPVWAMLLFGAALETADIHTGWVLIDEFAARYVYFYAGYAFAPLVFRLTESFEGRTLTVIAGLLAWAAVNAGAVATGAAGLPVVSLALGFAGAVAISAMAVLLTRLRVADLLRHAGEHSLVIYLAFFLPMAATRIGLLKLGVVDDVGTVSLIVTVTAVSVPLLIHLAVKNTPARFLFERPGWAHLRPRPSARDRLAPAE